MQVQEVGAWRSFTYVLQEKILQKIRKRPHVIWVEYERLVQDTDAELRRMCTDCYGRQRCL